MAHTTSPQPATDVETPRPGGWTIAELARQTDLTPDTLRYYERIHLLPAPARTSGSHRRYGPDALDRLHFIQGSRRLGLKLDEIADLLAVRDTGNCPCEPAAGLLNRRIADIDAEMERLTALRAELVTMADALPADNCPDPTPGTWRLPQSASQE
uniref:Transcriptional regulator, MerR family n=2 Tax=unclassified Streptomyces TaxID=2593676 RepID=V9Z678_9ACTN|nr:MULTISPECIES: heavy metal-responsive transcriptional regulator [unclassified Streptomyces]AHE39011.1 Transcriptional regulator, merR family [Streptomyces sp. FR1]AHE39509.1 Transcriptional regulator, MerR family [Streptomyces sp. F2]